jgi:hypothetical protein
LPVLVNMVTKTGNDEDGEFAEHGIRVDQWSCECRSTGFKKFAISCL